MSDTEGEEGAGKKYIDKYRRRGKQHATKIEEWKGGNRSIKIERGRERYSAYEAEHCLKGTVSREFCFN